MAVNGVINEERWAPRFFAIFAGQAFSLFGSMLVQFALVWWLTQTTGSATVLATATLVAVLPMVFVGPFAGALVDRWNRRLVMILADSLSAVVALAVVALFATDLVQVWHIYVAMFLRAVLGAFHWPAMTASTSLLVPPAHLARVAGLNQMLQGGMNIIAPPAGALLLTLLPMYWVLAVDVITALLAVVPLLFVAIPQPARDPAAAPTAAPSVLADMRVGFAYVRGWTGLALIMAMAMLINFAMVPSSSLMPLLVTDHFRGGALQLASLQSAMGIGSVLGGVLLGVWGGFKRRILTSLLGLIGMAVGMVVMGVAPATAFGLGVAAMFTLGLMLPLVNGPIMAIVQAKVAPEMQGRVFSLMGSLSAAMMPVSLLLAGPLSDWLGVRTWYIIAGVICAGMGVMSLALPAVLHIESHGDVPRELAPAVVPVEAEG